MNDLKCLATDDRLQVRAVRAHTHTHMLGLLCPLWIRILKYPDVLEVFSAVIALAVPTLQNFCSDVFAVADKCLRS